jgi:hypothetical protein
MIVAVPPMMKLATYICVVGNQNVRKAAEGFFLDLSRIRNSYTYKLIKKMGKDFSWNFERLEIHLHIN